ncbi:MAG: low molecular weight protein-tyrosine-phosphatase [bacterium]
MSQVSVMFVCLGNICRSPAAHWVFHAKVQNKGLADRITIASSGTGDWHIGRPADRRMVSAAEARGYDLSRHRAQQINGSDFSRFDYVFAMDRQNLEDLEAMRPNDFSGQLGLFLAAGSSGEAEVPDPYYGGDAGFKHVLDLVETTCDDLLNTLLSKHLS